MATMSVPDRKPMGDVYGDASRQAPVSNENTKLRLPIVYSPKTGYISSTDLGIGTFDVGSIIRLTFEFPARWATTDDSALSSMPEYPIIARFGDNHILTPLSFIYYPNGIGNGTDKEQCDVVLSPIIPGKRYVYQFDILQSSFVAMSVFDEGGSRIALVNLNVVGMFTSPFDVYVGWPDATTLNNYENLDLRNRLSAKYFNASYPMQVKLVDMYAASEPTDLSVSPSTLDLNHNTSNYVGTFSTVHDRETSGFEYQLVAGAGSTNNDRFEIIGDKLYKPGALGVGNASIRVRTTDRFRRYFEKVLTISLVSL